MTVSRWVLAAVTISLRYLHMRRQFADPDLKPGEPGFGKERQVISYPGVYRRVLPVLAKTIVFITAGKDMVRSFRPLSLAIPICLTHTLRIVEFVRIDVFATRIGKHNTSRRNSCRFIRT